MLEETIKAVKDAEQKADAIVAQAKKDADRIRSDNRKAIEDLKARTASDGERELNDALDKARADGEKRLAEAKAADEASAKSIREEALKKQNDAIQAVIDAVTA